MAASSVLVTSAMTSRVRPPVAAVGRSPSSRRDTGSGGGLSATSGSLHKPHSNPIGTTLSVFISMVARFPGSGGGWSATSRKPRTDKRDECVKCCPSCMLSSRQLLVVTQEVVGAFLSAQVSCGNGQPCWRRSAHWSASMCGAQLRRSAHGRLFRGPCRAVSWISDSIAGCIMGRNNSLQRLHVTAEFRGGAHQCLLHGGRKGRKVGERRQHVQRRQAAGAEPARKCTGRQ